MLIAEIQNGLSNHLGDKHRYFVGKLESCQSLEEVLTWVHQSCHTLAGEGLLTSELLLSYFTVAQLESVQVFVRKPDMGVLLPEKHKVIGFYYVFGGHVVQSTHSLHGSFYEGAVVEAKAGHASFYDRTSGTLNGPAIGNIFQDARVTALGGSTANFYNQATGVGKERSHTVCMGCSTVELFDQAYGLALENSKMTLHDTARGRGMGDSMSLCCDKSEVIFGEKAVGLLMTSGRVESTGPNVLYQFKPKAKILENRTTSIINVPTKEADHCIKQFEEFVPAPAKRFELNF